MRAIGRKRLRETCQGAARGRADDAFPPDAAYNPGKPADGGAGIRATGERDGGSAVAPKARRFLQTIAKPHAWQSPPGADRARLAPSRRFKLAKQGPATTIRLGMASSMDPCHRAAVRAGVAMVTAGVPKGRPAGMSSMPSAVVRARLLSSGDEVESEVDHVRLRPR
jgi:hypothetical protein